MLKFVPKSFRSNFGISQGGVATVLRWGGQTYGHLLHLPDTLYHTEKR